MRGAPIAAQGWLRAGSLAAVGVLWFGVRTSALDPVAQRNVLLFAASGLGYGHLLAAVCFGRSGRSCLRQRVLVGLAALAGGITFAQLLLASTGPVLLLPLAALALWHTLENELAIARTEAGSLRLPPLTRALRPHALSAGAALVILVAVLLLPRFAPWLVGLGAPLWLVRTGPDEVVAALLLHHSLVWLGRSLVAAPRSSSCMSGRRAALAILHTLPLIGLVALGQVREATSLAFLTSPALFLFLSVAHAFHTCFERGLEPR
jgi:hypothetical protein